MAKHLNRKAKRKRFHKDTHFLEVVGDISYGGLYDVTTKVELLQYSPSQMKRQSLNGDFKIKDYVNDDAVSWFKVTGFSDVDQISSIFKECCLDRFEIKNLLAGQTTRIVSYADITYILMCSCWTDENSELHTVQFGFILGRNFLISFHEMEMPIINRVMDAFDKQQAQVRYKTADLLLCLLCNSVYTQYVDVTTKLIDHLGEYEELLIDNAHFGKDVMAALRVCRTNYRTLRRILSPIHEELSDLLLNTNGLVLQENIKYFTDFDDKIGSSLSDLEIYNDMIKSSMDIYYSNGDQHMNDIMKRLTIVATIFIPLTFLAGVWGMNFESMPEKDWKYGYFFAWGTMLLVGLITAWYLKRKKWL